MKIPKLACYLFLFTFVLSACGTLDKKTILINLDDDKSKVLEIMGPPDDRQMEGQSEAWQYCKSTYRSQTTGCTGGFRTIRWEDAPHEIKEYRLKMR